MAPSLSVFGLSLQAYPLFLLIGVTAGLWLAARQARRLGLDADHVYNLGFYALLATVVGARLAFVVRNWPAYRDTPLSALSPTTTAFAWPEGAAIGLLAALIYGLRHRLPLGRTLDALAPGLALAMAIERLGAFLGGINFGEPTTLPWGVSMWGEVRHPAQLYEMLALLAILAVLLWVQRGRSFDKLRTTPFDGSAARADRRVSKLAEVELRTTSSDEPKATPFDGYTFVLFVALYSGSRLLLEAFRADATLISGGLRAAQLVALGVMLAAIWYLYRRRFAASTGG